MSTLLWEKDLVDIAALIPGYSGDPIRVKNDGESYISNFDDPHNHWLTYAFEAFKKIKKRSGQDGIKKFISVASGPGIDAIGAMEILNPEKVTVTDLTPQSIKSAKGNINRYQKGKKHAIPVEYMVGDLCDPLTGCDADIIYANLPNIPFSGDQFDLMKGVNAASFFLPKSSSRVPNDLNRFLLGHQYDFLMQAKSHLSPGKGQVVINLGIRFPVDLVEKLFTEAGYEHEILAYGLKKQTEPTECLPGYSMNEDKENGVRFDFYPYDEAQKLIESALIKNLADLKTLLEPIKLSATEANNSMQLGTEVCHVVAVIGAKPLGSNSTTQAVPLNPAPQDRV